MNRKKLEPLGKDPESDEAKKMLPRKESDRKLLEEAYENAILFHSKLKTYERNTTNLLSEESSDESD